MSKTHWVENILDGAVAAWMGCSVGAAFFLSGSGGNAPNLLYIISVAAVLSALLTYRVLASSRRPRHSMPKFDLLPIETVKPDWAEESAEELLLTRDMAVLTSELLLTRGQMLHPPVEKKRVDPLVLDDVLAQLKPDSRVVQLFDSARMPTAGELKSRIDKHLSGGGRVASDGEPTDATQALYDALAELRRSLA